MKDKELQRELWREDKAVNSLEDVLRIIRAGEATYQQQSALSNQAVVGVCPGMKCFDCGKAGHLMANCPSKSSSSNQSLSSRKCSFCGAAKRCSIKNCKGYNMQCSKCKLFGHVG